MTNAIGLLILLSLSCTSLSAIGQIQSVTKVFILRHADKAGEDLSPAGQERAKELKRVLGEAKIDSIFSTDAPRTKHTAEVLALSLGLPVIIYKTEDVVIKRVLKTCQGKRVLIVGHSNTVSSLISKCGCTPPASITPNIPDTQFDNLFLVLASKDQQTETCEVIHMKYGAYGQEKPVHTNPWTPANIGTMPPIQSLSNGVWLKGELHLHSRHSKDASNNSVAKVLAFCKSVGIDFICITDHDNHVDGDVANNTWLDPEFKSDSVLLLYGAEWTTTRGHGNVFSAKPYDHQRLFDVRDQRDVVVGTIKKGLGIHLSANHPSGKDHFGYSFDIVNSIEVWNSSTWAKNANAIMIWDDMLSSGRKLTGRGGSDSHHGVPDSPDKATSNTPLRKTNYAGTPTNWVFASARTSQAAVDALTNGRVSISANPFAPRVELYADTDQDGKPDMMMGDNAKSTGKPAKFRVQLTGKLIPDSTYTINVIKNGSLFGAFKATAKSPAIEFTDAPATTDRTYYRVMVEGPQTLYPQVPESMALSGNMVALSNPIYFNFDPNF